MGEQLDLGLPLKDARKKLDRGVLKQRTCMMPVFYSYKLDLMSQSVGEKKSSLVKIFLMEVDDNDFEVDIMLHEAADQKRVGDTFSLSAQSFRRLQELSQIHGQNENYILRCVIYFGLKDYFGDISYKKKS